MPEEWREVLGGFYEVSRDGLVRRSAGGKGARKGKLLKQFIASMGYRVVNVCTYGKDKVAYVHALVAEAFIGPRPEGMQINHINGIKIDCSPENLEYVTQDDNAKHAGRIGLVQSGDNHWTRRRTA
jgi:hypothetical protein